MTSLGIDYEDLETLADSEAAGGRNSYCEALTGRHSQNAWEEDDSMSEEGESIGRNGSDSDDDYTDFYETTCNIVEHVRGPISVPEFKFTEKEERRINKPFKRSLIVKLLGRMISLKALENKVQKMWARNGIVTVVDIPNDFFVATFTNEKDYDFALEGGTLDDL